LLIQSKFKNVFQIRLNHLKKTNHL